MMQRLYTPKMDIKEVVIRTLIILVDSLPLDSHDKRIEELKDLVLEMNNWGKKI